MNKNLTVFINKLPWTVGHIELRKFFNKFGRVRKAEIAFDWTTGISRGFGFVTFREKEGYEKAVKQGTAILDGGTIQIRPDGVNRSRGK